MAAVLEVTDLKVSFPSEAGVVAAIRGLNYHVDAGEVLAVVGEAGSGKSVSAPAVMGLLPATAQVTGSVRLRGQELLRLVGLGVEHVNRYPAQFSDGQRQRIGIARAHALEPKVIVLDEPVSALNLSVQAGVINLLARLKATLGLAYLFVSHDLSVIRHIADRVAVMETGQVFDAPSHPYAQALLSAVPLPDLFKEQARRRLILSGDVPDPVDPPSSAVVPR